MLSHPVWTYVLIVGGIGLVLSHFWRPVEKCFPALNAFIHSDISDRNDVDYQVYKLQQNEKAYKAEISIYDKPQTSSDTCEAAYIAAQPMLNRMSDRIEKLERAWQKEGVLESMPVACRQMGDAYFKSFNDYVTEKRRALDAVKWALPHPVIDFSSWPKECAGY